MEDVAQDTDGTFQVEGRLTLFGHEPTPAVVRIRPRSRAWRLGGAVRAQAVGLVLAPLVGLLPPHAPWALGALGGGFFLARKRWRHHHTVESVSGPCPRCGAPVDPRPGMLRTPHPVPCEACHHDASLEVDPGALPGLGKARD